MRPVVLGENIGDMMARSLSARELAKFNALIGLKNLTKEGYWKYSGVDGRHFTTTTLWERQGVAALGKVGLRVEGSFSDGGPRPLGGPPRAHLCSTDLCRQKQAAGR